MVIGLVLIPVLLSAVVLVFSWVDRLGPLLHDSESFVLELVDLLVVELSPLISLVIAVFQGCVALSFINVLLLVLWLVGPVATFPVSSLSITAFSVLVPWAIVVFVLVVWLLVWFAVRFMFSRVGMLVGL